MNDNYVELIAEEDIEEYINIRWDFVIADEAHKLLANKRLYTYFHSLSKRSENILLLSATPVQQKKEAYLALLQLIMPDKYDHFSIEDFQTLVEKQKNITKSTYLVLQDFDDYIDNIADTLEDGENPLVNDDCTDLFDDIQNGLRRISIHYMNHAVLYKEVGDGQYISIKGKLYLFSDKIGFYGGSDTYEILLDDIVAIMEFEGIPIILEVLTNGENLYISTPNTEVLFKVLHTIESSKSEDDMKYMKIETTIEKIIEGADLDSYIFYFEDVQHSQICEDMEKQIGILIEKLHKLSTALEKYPDKVEGTHRFSNYYLPETLRLIFAHQQYLTAGVSKEQIDKVYIKVMESIDTVITAVERKIDSIYQVATMDTIAKANALQKIMGQDGYVKGEGPLKH